ncbi:MAG: HIT family protein [Phycisphaerales bacterium]
MTLAPGSVAVTAEESGRACPLCQSVARALAGEHPLFIAELDAAVLLLHEHQPLAGWSVLLLKDHAEHADLLADEVLARVHRDMIRAARAVRAATGCARVNYACLGTVEPHVHWHIIPRFAPPIDPEPRATVWTRPAEWLNRGVMPEQAAGTIAKVRSALGMGLRGA